MQAGMHFKHILYWILLKNSNSMFVLAGQGEMRKKKALKRENIQLPEIYFAHGRNCVVRDGQLLALSEYINLSDDDIITNKKVRFRTVGDMTCTAGVESNAGTIDDVINELKLSRTSERGETRLDDKTSEAAMEDRKKAGYF